MSSKKDSKPKTPRAALTPAEKRAKALRENQKREEAALARAKAQARREAKQKKLEESANKPDGGTVLSSDDDDVDAAHHGDVDGVDGELDADAVDDELNEHLHSTHISGNASPVAAAPPANLDEYDSDDEAADAEEKKKQDEEDYDIVLDGPKPPLISATANKLLHEVKALIQAVPIEMRVEYANACDDHGCSALFFALGPDHLDCLQLLLDYGADPNHQNNKKNGPLHIACALQHKKAVKMLVEHGANIMLENWQYQKPHEMVKEHDKVSVMQAFLNTCYENWMEKIAEKELLYVKDRYQRSYYRSLYDIADTQGLGVLKFENIEPLLDVMSDNGILMRQEQKYSSGFFKNWDADKNGVISFSEFLQGTVAFLNERARQQKKAKRRALNKLRRAKKREEDLKNGKRPSPVRRKK